MIEILLIVSSSHVFYSLIIKHDINLSLPINLFNEGV